MIGPRNKAPCHLSKETNDWSTRMNTLHVVRVLMNFILAGLELAKIMQNWPQ